MVHRVAVLLVLALTTLSGCEEDEQPIGEQTCGWVTQRCRWNPETRHYDKDCMYITSDAGKVERDAGCAAFPDGGPG